jgi:predicted permease
VLSAGALNGGMLTGYLATPGTIGAGVPMLVEGQAPKRTNMPGGRSFITPRFFETMGIPLVAGREFTERDTDTAPPVVIINETTARFFFDNQNPVGRFVRFSANDIEPTEIVGVVKDFVRGTPRGVSQPELLTFFSYRHREALNRGAQSRLRIMMVAVRTSGDPLGMAARVRQELREIDPNLPVMRINTIEEQLSDVLAQDRLTAALSGVFGALAALLASIGLYGVLSYAVARRTNEIGIRLALGAQPGDALRLVIMDGMKLALVGILLGLFAALALTRLIKGLLYGVNPTDPLTYFVGTALLALVALLACWIPARRAAKVDPMIALRCE